MAARKRYSVEQIIASWKATHPHAAPTVVVMESNIGFSPVDEVFSNVLSVCTKVHKGGWMGIWTAAPGFDNGHRTRLHLTQQALNVCTGGTPS